MKNVDILLIPVGGTYTIDARQAKDYIEAIQPKIVIPMHYKPIDGALDIDTIDSFLQYFDEEIIMRTKDEYHVIKHLLPQNMKIVVMERV
jgi:L-ascorbate metabolism protein UlaG (beta-lactamase superfamily)